MSFPVTPSGGTLGTPLVTVATYRRVTQDTVTDEEAITQALADAVVMFCEKTWSSLAYGQYNETPYLYKNGMVFPSATPIDRTKAISSQEKLYTPVTTNQSNQGSIIQGDGIWVGWFTPLPWMPVWTGVIPPQTNVSYWGGYYPYGTLTADQVTTETLPMGIMRCLVRIAYYVLHPAVLAGMPGGAKSMSVGGVSMSGDLSSFVAADPQLRRDIRKWRHAQVHAWQT